MNKIRAAGRALLIAFVLAGATLILSGTATAAPISSAVPTQNIGPNFDDRYWDKICSNKWTNWTSKKCDKRAERSHPGKGNDIARCVARALASPGNPLSTLGGGARAAAMAACAKNPDWDFSMPDIEDITDDDD